MRYFLRLAGTCVYLLFVLITSCSDGQEDSVHLSGKLINWGNAQQVLFSDALAGDFGLAEDHVITTNEAGEFNLTFELKEPTYFSLGRNKLYLQPGDDLSLEVDYKDPQAAVFKGDHAALQSYLRGVAFPKAGSYLEAGRNIESSNILEVLELVEQRTAERRSALQKLNGPEGFTALELVRLRLDAINTLLSFPIYGSFKGYWDANSIQKATVLKPVAPQLNQWADDIMQDAYMSLPNFRDMLYELNDSHLKEEGIFSQLIMTAFMRSYDAFGAMAKQLELEGLTEENQAFLNEYLSKEESEKYREMTLMKQAEYASLNLGEPAIDLLLSDATEKERKLSEFKGELIYVDLWATWCGPCIAELPALETLKEVYQDDPITFLPLSIDSDEEAWQKYLAKNNRPLDMEFLINRQDLSDYKVITIPRYLLIDADFNLISAFAPKPSDPEVRTLIDQFITKQ